MPTDVRVQATDSPVAEAQLATMADAVLEALGLGEAELSVLLTTDAHIAEINEAYRGIAAPTDVLSFPQDEGPSVAVWPGPPRVLGDVVIADGTSRAQAAELGHDVTHELWVLLVHGVLHLLGHDHETDEQRAAMTAEEQRVLAAVGQADRSGLVARSSDG